MDAEQIAHKLDLIAQYRKNLRLLEIQKSQYSHADFPVHIQNSIDGCIREIKKLERDLLEFISENDIFSVRELRNVNVGGQLRFAIITDKHGNILKVDADTIDIGGYGNNIYVNGVTIKLSGVDNIDIISSEYSKNSVAKWQFRIHVASNDGGSVEGEANWTTRPNLTARSSYISIEDLFFDEIKRIKFITIAMTGALKQ